MDNIIYSTPEEQIEKLKSQNLIIEDETAAKRALHVFGYSNLIKSYREPYIITSDNGKVYRSGVSFNQILSLFLLDKNLRNGVMASMLDLEEHFKEATADVIANAFGTHQDDYLQYRNYRNKKKRFHRFTLAGIMETLQKTLCTEKNPIHHYKEVHEIVPPWILFTSIYFSTMINFVDQFKIKEQNELTRRLYDLNDLKIPDDSVRTLMMDTLYICLDYRNTAAHGGRIYNLNSKNKLRVDKIFGRNPEHEINGFNQLLLALSLLNYESPFEQLKNILDEEVNRHCSLFPQDVTYLGQILNIDITSRDVAFITSTSRKYHSNPYCSGMNNAHLIELEKAKEQGYIPCKSCNTTR